MCCMGFNDCQPFRQNGKMGNLIFLLLAGSTILLGSCGLIPEESETTTDSTVVPSDPTPSRVTLPPPQCIC